MSRLSDKAKGINLDLDGEDHVPAVSEQATGSAPNAGVVHREPPQESRPRTGIGMVARAMTADRELRQEADALKARVQALESGATTLQLDPQQVHPSRYANRHAGAFSTPAFDALKGEIAEAGGNVQPIKVRPRPGHPGTYEIVFGHRRHRACLELGLPVLAMVDQVQDVELFIQMDRENRGREDLSPWEQGVMYKQALESGLFPSIRKLGASIGVSHSNLVKVIGMAELPEVVVAAFASPIDLQFRWAAQLKAAVERDPQGVLARAAEAQKWPQPRSNQQVLQALLGTAPEVPESTVYEKQGRAVAELKQTRAGLQLTVKSGALSASQLGKLRDFLAKLLN